MKGILVQGKIVTRKNGDASMDTFYASGHDRGRVVESALSRVSEVLRAELRKKLGRVLEHEDEQIRASAQNWVDDPRSHGTYAELTVTPCEVIS